MYYMYFFFKVENLIIKNVHKLLLGIAKSCYVITLMPLFAVLGICDIYGMNVKNFRKNLEPLSPSIIRFLVRKEQFLFFTIIFHEYIFLAIPKPKIVVLERCIKVHAATLETRREG